MLLPDTYAWDDYDMLDDASSEAYRVREVAKAIRAERLAATTCDSVFLDDLVLVDE